MAGKEYLQEVVTVDFSGSRLTDADLAGLADHLAGLGRVRQLVLDHTDVTSDGVRYVTQMPEIRMLNLGRTRIDDRALGHVSALPRLQVLMLYETAVTDSGVSALISCRRLRLVNLYKTAVTTEGVKALASELPALRIGTPEGGLNWGEGYAEERAALVEP